MWSFIWFLFALGISVAFAYHGLQKQSLSPAGAFLAVLVGTTHMYSGPRFGLTLLVFYFTSSQFTKYKTDIKAKLEEDYRRHGQRKPVQVLANGLGGALLALLAVRYAGREEYRALDIALVAFLGHFACCCADTWSSELGILSEDHPILITTGKTVPRGTNGAISRYGTAAGALGGLLMGITFWVTGWLDSSRTHSGLSISLVPLGLLLGIIGTLLDSLLGAVCQYTGYSSKLGHVVGQPGPDVVHITGRHILTNDGINFAASASTALIGALIAYAGKATYPYDG